MTVMQADMSGAAAFGFPLEAILPIAEVER
jgi:hypothetical protein